MLADDDVIVADQPGERANRQDDGEGSVAGRQERSPDNIGLAGPPVAVKQGGRPLPVDVSRTMNPGAIHARPWSSRRPRGRANASLRPHANVSSWPESCGKDRRDVKYKRGRASSVISDQ